MPLTNFIALYTMTTAEQSIIKHSQSSVTICETVTIYICMQ